MGGRRLTILGLAGALALLPGSAGAGAPTETLRAAAEKVTQVLADPALQALAPAPQPPPPLPRRGQEASVVFRLHRPGERWLIYDVSVEGISLVANYRAQFDRIIQRASYQSLVTRIKEKLADGLSE